LALLKTFRFCHPIGPGLCLFFLAAGCGHPAYRLDGQVVDGASEVSLLDSAAPAVVDSLRQAYIWSLEDLKRSTEAALDSLSAGAASLEGPLVQARTRYQTARQRYRKAFEGMQRFKSFAGNSIFSPSDLRVKTSALLEDIADRSYQGKAFSLETESEVRRYIRNRLVELERGVNRTRSRVVRLERLRTGSAEGREKVEADFDRRSLALREDVNRKILEGLQESVRYRTVVDSTRQYRFFRIPAGTYHLFVPHPLPEAWLVRVKLSGHTRQDLELENRHALLIAESETG